MEKINKPTFVEKLEEEKKELDIKIKKLQQFIESNTLFSTLKIEAQCDLKNQLKVMNKYSNILKRRLNRTEV